VHNRRLAVGLVFAGLLVVPTARAADAARDDAAWLRTRGTLLFEDAFDRE